MRREAAPCVAALTKHMAHDRRMTISPTKPHDTYMHIGTLKAQFFAQAGVLDVEQMSTLEARVEKHMPLGASARFFITSAM